MVPKFLKDKLLLDCETADIVLSADEKLPRIPIDTAAGKLVAFLDSGSGICFIKQSVFETFPNAKIKSTKAKLKDFTGDAVKVNGKARICLTLDGKNYKTKFYVVDDMQLAEDMLLGRSFLNNFSEYAFCNGSRRIKFDNNKVIEYV